jgi:drug/metabolite transporter (DMT)-like permease
MKVDMTRAFAMLAFTILVWGVAPVFIRAFSLATGPADALAIRMVAGALACLPFMPFVGGFGVDRKDIPRLLLIGCVGFFGYFAGTIFGFAYAPAGIGSMIIATQPLVIALMAAMIGAERVTPAAIIGLVVSFAGTVYLFAGDVPQGFALRDIIAGGTMIFLGGVFFSVYAIASPKLVQKYGSAKIALLATILCALPSLAFISQNTLQTFRSLNGEAIFALTFLTLVGTLLCVATWNYAAARLPPTTVGASLYLIPVLAVLAGTIYLREDVTVSTIIAGAIILLGVAIAQFGPLLAQNAMRKRDLIE